MKFPQAQSFFIALSSLASSCRAAVAFLFNFIGADQLHFLSYQRNRFRPEAYIRRFTECWRTFDLNRDSDFMTSGKLQNQPLRGVTNK